jgi:hypothetical protein
MDYRIRELDEQEERITGLKIEVDADAYADGNTKFINVKELAPKSIPETETDGLPEIEEDLNRETTYVRINTGGESNAESVALLKYLFPDIINYTSASIFNATYTNYIHFYVGGAVAANYVISADNFATALFARPAFLARALALGIISGLTNLTMGAIALDDELRIYDKSATADRKITYQVLLNDMIGEDIFKTGATNANTEAIMLAKLVNETSYWGVELKHEVGGVVGGYLYLSKIGHQVTGLLKPNATMTDSWCLIDGDTYLAASWRPIDDIVFYNFAGAEDTVFTIYTDGHFRLIEPETTDPGGIGFSYCTAK